MKPGDLVQVQGDFSRVWGIILTQASVANSLVQSMWNVLRSDGTTGIYFSTQITTPEEL